LWRFVLTSVNNNNNNNNNLNNNLNHYSDRKVLLFFKYHTFLYINLNYLFRSSTPLFDSEDDDDYDSSQNFVGSDYVTDSPSPTNSEDDTEEDEDDDFDDFS